MRNSTSSRTRPIDVEAVMAETDHFVCCHHESVTYCGRSDASSLEGWADEVPCAACMAVVAMDLAGVYCPVEGVCSHALAVCSCPDDKP